MNNKKIILLMVALTWTAYLGAQVGFQAMQQSIKIAKNEIFCVLFKYFLLLSTIG